MTTQSQKQEILGLERQFWNTMQTKDGSGAGDMTDEGCIVVGAQGVSAIDSKTMAKMMSEGKWELKEYSFDEKTAQVRFITDDIALVAYNVTENLLVEGKPLGLEANDASVWVRRDGTWRCAMHSESLAGDPYGRDRQPSAPKK